MGLEERKIADVIVLTPRGMLLGGRETDELHEKIKELDQAGNQRLIIDLGKTTYMSSMGLAALFRARATYLKREAQVKVCCIDKKVRQMFVLVKLPLVYGDDVHETLEEALASFHAHHTT